MTVCLHCGELAEPGALFCTKCGWTLPQGQDMAAPIVPRPPVRAPSGASPVTPYSSAPAMPVAPSPLAGFALSAKPCIRCHTPIAPGAVYCPVCQSPQGP
ncbi:MAG: double zinc ribbon domain-containing protein [Thermoplasmata archaeon]